MQLTINAAPAAASASQQKLAAGVDVSNQHPRAALTGRGATLVRTAALTEAVATMGIRVLPASNVNLEVEVEEALVVLEQLLRRVLQRRWRLPRRLLRLLLQ